MFYIFQIKLAPSADMSMLNLFIAICFDGFGIREDGDCTETFRSVIGRIYRV